MDEFKVFLSSPDDVKDDVDELEKFLKNYSENTIKKHEIRVVPLTWKNAQKGVIRPQKAINKLLRPCDLYVGLLWKRFGSPTGVTISGTFEEFTIAVNNFEQDNRPQVRLFFKKVSESAIAYKDKHQLELVNNFKKNITNTIFHDSYCNISEVKEKLKEEIDSFLLELPIIKRFDVSNSTVKEGEKVTFFYDIMKTELPLKLHRSYDDGTYNTNYNLMNSRGDWTDKKVIKDSTYMLVASNNYGRRTKAIKVKVTDYTKFDSLTKKGIIELIGETRDRTPERQ